MPANYVLEEVSWAVDKMTMRDVCFACLDWLHELLVGTLISLMNTYAGCSTPTLNFIEHFDFGLSVQDSEAGLMLLAVVKREKIWALKDVLEIYEGTFEQEAVKSRAHFIEYPEVFQNSCLYPSSSSTHVKRWLFRNVLQRGLMANVMHTGLSTRVTKYKSGPLIGVAQSGLSGKYGAHVTLAFVMQSGLLACGGVLAGVLMCGLLVVDY